MAWKFPKLILALGLILGVGLPAKYASAEAPKSQHRYTIDRHRNTNCSIDFTFSNPETGERDALIQVSGQAVEFAIKHAKILGERNQFFVLVEYGVDAGILLQSAGEGSLYAWILKRFAKSASPGARRQFVLIAIAGTMSYRWIEYKFFETEERRTIRYVREKVLPRLRAYETDTPSLLNEVRRTLPRNLSEVREGSCQPHRWQRLWVEKNVFDSVRNSLTAGLDEEERERLKRP